MADGLRRDRRQWHSRLHRGRLGFGERGHGRRDHHSAAAQRVDGRRRAHALRAELAGLGDQVVPPEAAEPPSTRFAPLVEQIGWDLRYKWDNFASTWRLTLWQPNRSASSPDQTFAARLGAGSVPVVTDVRTLHRTIEPIRNVVRVIYSDSTDLDGNTPRRKIIEVSDSGSISSFGRRWMEVAESSSSNLDSSTEATTLANAILGDLKNAGADVEVDVQLFPWVQLGDFYTFSAPFPQFDVAQSFGVVGYTHSIDGAGTAARTTLTLRGKPSGAFTGGSRRMRGWCRATLTSRCPSTARAPRSPPAPRWAARAWASRRRSASSRSRGLRVARLELQRLHARGLDAQGQHVQPTQHRDSRPRAREDLLRARRALRVQRARPARALPSPG